MTSLNSKRKKKAKAKVKDRAEHSRDLVVRVHEDFLDALDEIATKELITRSEWVRGVLKEAVDNYQEK